jgi:hypothetical protein
MHQRLVACKASIVFRSNVVLGTNNNTCVLSQHVIVIFQYVSHFTPYASAYNILYGSRCIYSTRGRGMTFANPVACISSRGV